MKTRTTLILSLTIIITFAAGSAFGKYSGGTGEPNNPYQIATKADLLVLAADANDYGKCFILTADINMEGQVFTTAIIAPDINLMTSGFQGTPFTGTFDGNDYKITHFIINGGTKNYIALFGEIASFDASVKNLGIENFTVSGNDYVGGLVGANYFGSINNCYSMGNINISDSSESQHIGGLVGYNNGYITNCHSMDTINCASDSYTIGTGVLVGTNGYDGHINDCYSTGTVNCDIYGGQGDRYMGGLVGWNYYGNISNCYSMGTMNGYSYVGGLVGYNYHGNISQCYSMTAVSGGLYVGGLVGYKYYGSISNCYSTGTVSGFSYVGGLAGRSDGGNVISNSFWDTQTSGRTTSEGGTGKTTSEMKTLSTFTSANWEFVDAWGIGNGQTYPYLKPFNGINPADLNYSGTVDMRDFAILAEHWLEGNEIAPY